MHQQDEKKSNNDLAFANTKGKTTTIDFLKELEIREITQILRNCRPSLVSSLLRELLLDQE